MDFRYSFDQIPHSDFVIHAVENKIGHSVRYLFGQSDIHVTFRRRGHEFTINVAIKGKGGVYYKASASHENLYAAIDDVQAKLEKQFLKKRKKIKNHKRYELSKEGRMEWLDEGLSLDISRRTRGRKGRSQAA